jgi:hypothetical protein
MAIGEIEFKPQGRLILRPLSRKIEKIVVLAYQFEG